MHFSHTFDYIYLTKLLIRVKIGYPSEGAFLLTICIDKKFLPSVSEAF